MSDRKAALKKEMDWLKSRTRPAGEFVANQAIHDTLCDAFGSAAHKVLATKIGGATPDDLAAAEQYLTTITGYAMPAQARKALTTEVKAALADPKAFDKFVEMHQDVLAQDADCCGQLMINMLLGSDDFQNSMESPATAVITPQMLRPALTPVSQSWNEICICAADRYALAPSDVDELICAAWNNLSGGTRDVPINTKLTVPGAAIKTALAHKFTAA